MYEGGVRAFMEASGAMANLSQLLVSQVANGRRASEWMAEDEAAVYRTELARAITLFDQMGARASRDACRRASESLQSPMRLSDIQMAVGLARAAFFDEMTSWRVLFLNDREAVTYDRGEIEYFGLDVWSAFPSARFNMTEASKCFVLNRWTAATYHCMGIVEVGIKALCAELKASIDLDSYDTTWEKMRRAIEAELKPYKDPANNNQESKPRRKQSHPQTWDQDEAFFFGCADDIRAIQRAYRNPSMHFRTVFASDEEQATRVLNSTAGFMRDLSSRVQEKAQA